MALLTPEIHRYIGVATGRRRAVDAVERGAVRRYAQAVMDEDNTYMDDHHPRHGAAVAPPLYPAFMFRAAFGAADPLTEQADNADFDGLVTSVINGLPELPVPHLALLNGGVEIELLRYARHGEAVFQRSRYVDITGRESRAGPMLLVVVETVYETDAGEILLRVKQTVIRR